MIGFDEADQLASGSSRYHHMLLVSCLMGRAAVQLDVDQSLWRLVGLLHDIDYDATRCNRDKHGLLGAEWLCGKLPNVGVEAIRRHDHRAGLMPRTDLDFGLILCDSVSIVLDDLNRKPPIKHEDFLSMLERVSVEKPWLKKLVLENPVLEKIDLVILLHSQ